MSTPFTPFDLISNSLRIDGVNVLKVYFPVGYWMEYAVEVTESYSDFPSDQGFGSSDMTYAVKSLLDTLIRVSNLGSRFETQFTPCLTVVEK